MALTVKINRATQLTRDVEVKVEVPPVEEGGEPTIEKQIQTEHVGWDVAANIKGKSHFCSSSFFIDDLPATATEKDFESWVKAKYKEAQGK